LSKSAGSLPKSEAATGSHRPSLKDNLKQAPGPSKSQSRIIEMIEEAHQASPKRKKTSAEHRRPTGKTGRQIIDREGYRKMEDIAGEAKT
jgi:hypothetical protein